MTRNMSLHIYVYCELWKFEAEFRFLLKCIIITFIWKWCQICGDKSITMV